MYNTDWKPAEHRGLLMSMEMTVKFQRMGMVKRQASAGQGGFFFRLFCQYLMKSLTHSTPLDAVRKRKTKISFFSTLLLNGTFEFKFILYIFCYLKIKMTVLTLWRTRAWSYFSQVRNETERTGTLKILKWWCVSVCVFVYTNVNVCVVGKGGKNAHISD